MAELTFRSDIGTLFQPSQDLGEKITPQQLDASSYSFAKSMWSISFESILLVNHMYGAANRQEGESIWSRQGTL